MTQAEQIEYIKEHYLDTPVKRIALEIGRSSCYVYAEMKRQDLAIPKEIMKDRKRAGQFKKGQEPPNKGKKQHEFMSPEAIEKTKATRFQKGNRPHNTRADFALSIRKSKGRPYYWIRVALSKWVLLHRYLWELHYGEIEKGMNIQFKDGDSLNCNIENLYAIDRKYQLTVNNKGGKKLPYETKALIHIIEQLKDKINEKQN